MEMLVMAAVSLAIATASNEVGLTNGTNADYERDMGHYLVGEPYHRLEATPLNYCIMTCTGSPECAYMNVLHEQLVTETRCELFNVSSIVNAATLKNSESATFYKKSVFKDCLEVKKVKNSKVSGIYAIVLPNKTPNQAFCDMETEEGGWTLLQRRIDGSVDFDRDWQSYKIGFGNLESNFWLGLDAGHWFTKDGNVTLRFDLWDGPSHYFMEYHGVTIADETENYRLNWESVTGNTTIDSMSYHKNMDFSTKDNDNDVHISIHCADNYGGGWWFKECSRANLNGDYGSVGLRGVHWRSITGLTRSLSKAEMKVRMNDL